MPVSPERTSTPPGGDDPTATAVVEFLRAEGADRCGHAGGRDLLDHLVGTYEIVRRWGQPSWCQHAGLVHSVYGTDAYRRQLIPLSRRPELRAMVGERAERLAYLFAITPRRLVLAGTLRWAPGTVAAPGDRSDQPSATTPIADDEIDALVVLHLANLADQARAPDGSPGTWLVALRDAAELVLDSGSVTAPAFLAALSEFTSDDESAVRGAYRDGLAQMDRAPGAERLAMAAAACPVVGEPCVWLAYAAWRRGDPTASRDWASTARRRLIGLGTAWDKRLRYDEWLTVTTLLGRPAAEIGSVSATDPEQLYREVTGAHAGHAATSSRTLAHARPQPADATARFQRYMSAMADAAMPGGRLLYPGLDRRPWWEPTVSRLAIELESRCQEIRDEILALEPARFVPESERIPRTGDWDVVFFYERGRRHDEVCDACPATTRVIEDSEAMRTAAGLIYVSRMRPGTHIQAHRGPTNLRLRCHLGISVPEGDCAIRVAEQTERWSEGHCLVFDDSFEHEAWNRTNEDRIVLIVDLWHPGLSSAEVRLLTGLHRYASGYAQRLDRYWAMNAAARGESPRT